jgi:hypothetical protein
LLFLRAHTRAYSHPHARSLHRAGFCAPPAPCSPLLCPRRPRPSLARWPWHSPAAAHLPCCERTRTRDGVCSAGPGAGTGRKKRESKAGGRGSFTSPGEGDRGAPCTLWPRSWCRRKCAAARELQLRWSVGGGSPGRGASLLPGPHRSLDSSARASPLFLPELGRVASMHLRNPSSCAKDSPQS